MKQKNEQALKKPENGPDMTGQKNSENRSKSEIALLEEKVLQFWQANEIFKKSVEREAPRGEFVFYDGPPFATGMPHYGHILAGILKDAIPRYQTMRGHRVMRRWGWDCHGLPIEKLVQDEQNLNTKKDIENFGIKNFNAAAKATVFRYDKEWKEIIPRTGRFVDMENKYTTMDASFSESVMWAFKTLYDKGLVYESFQSMHISPPLETPLSNFEVNQNYKDITDISVYAKFELVDEPNTFVIAWTTTPWTLPGNVALAVGAEIDYVKVEITGDSRINAADTKGNYVLGTYILAKARMDFVLKNKIYKIISELKGADLVGKSYKPLFDYYANNSELENRENGWKIYSAEFVTTTDGSGVVHIAPAFGEDDLNLGKAHKLPFVQHVNIDGSIKSEVTDFAGRQAKPKATKENPNAHQDTDIEVVKYLAHHGTLFEKEKFTHSYPHCWRTDAPLLNYALSSWFVRVTDFRDKMVKLNKKVKWVPEAVGEKRFGNWLENIKDWGVSRSRFWGTPIPVWQSEDKTETLVLGSLAEIRDKTRSTNNYIVMRHGEADNNVKRILSSDNSTPSNLTENGKNNVARAAEELKTKKIDLIIASPLLRTKQTAEIVATACGISKDAIVFDDRIKEIQAGEINGMSVEQYKKLFPNRMDKFVSKPKGGENLVDVKKRVGDFIYEIDSKYQNKNILIVTHEYATWMLDAVRLGANNVEASALKEKGVDYVPTSHFMQFDFAPIPHNDEYELDFHRPFIDEIKFTHNGKQMTRVKDVFDTWFDSGSMPFAINHYPFKKDTFNPGSLLTKSKGFPADFIAEGLDQTRGWFYTLLALNTALFGKAPYKNVVANGLVLAEDGRKMSKRLKNYPDVEFVLDKYGADALRYYMISSPIVRSEPLNFSEKGIDEVLKKISNRLLNVVSFYKMYGAEDHAESDVRPASDNPLDVWILNRLSEVAETTTKSMDNYELDRASRPIFDFVDDLSTWYVRRSRDRFKDAESPDTNMATKTLAYVLLNLAKLMAPFMPFLAEKIYQDVTAADFGDANKSVHLLAWPTLAKSEANIISEMQNVRDVVAVALEARDRVGIKVRQPLATLTLSAEFEKLSPALLEIIKDEVNVKSIAHKTTLKSREVELDSVITDALKREGIARDLIRHVQSLRKDKKLDPSDVIELVLKANTLGATVVSEFETEIKNVVNAKKIATQTVETFDGETFTSGEATFVVKL